MPNFPHDADQVSAAVDAHVREIVETAQRAADDLQHEVEVEATRRATEIRRRAEEEASRILRTADEDAARVRHEAERAARSYLEDSRRRVDAFAEGRVKRITDLTDTLIGNAASITDRLGQAAEMHASLRDLVDALATAARAASAEGSRPAVRLPGIDDTRRAARPEPDEVELDAGASLDEAPPPRTRPGDLPFPARPPLSRTELAEEDVE